MKKILMALVALFIGFQAADAQNAFYPQGKSMFSVGVGVNSGYISEIVVPPLSISYEYCIKDNLFDAKSSLGLGGELAFFSAKTSGDHKANFFAIGPRLNLHYNFVPNLDTYVGTFLGYRNWSFEDKNYVGENYTKSGFDWGLYLGIRYNFTPMIGAFLEGGMGYTNATLGVSFTL